MSDTKTYVAALRAVADFLQERPQLSTPQIDHGARVTWHLNREPAWREIATEIMDAVGGEWTKKVITDFQTLDGSGTRLGSVCLFVPLYEAPSDFSFPTVDLTGLPGLAVA